MNIDSLLQNLALPLLVTFLTYLVSQHLFRPVAKWRAIKDDLITDSIQYANYVAYLFTNKDGKRILDDRGMMNTVEQELRHQAGSIATLIDYKSYLLWRGWTLPTEKEIDEIRGDLIGWSNSLIEKDGKYNPNRDVRIESLKKHLGLANYYSEVREMQMLDWKREREH